MATIQSGAAISQTSYFSKCVQTAWYDLEG